MTQILSGKPAAEEIIATVSRCCEASGVVPGLAVIQVGNNSASTLYVKKKVEKTRAMGWVSEHIHLPDMVSETELSKKLDALNRSSHIHGILVQLPLPDHLSVFKVLEKIDPAKDVDGFHPLNVGRLVCGLPLLAPPCTPYGVMALLNYYQISVVGKNVIVLGRSNIVGKPMAHMLIQAGASVLWTHRHSQNVPALARQADIIITATGHPKLITREYVHSKSVLMDIGINTWNGKTVGDVDVDAVDGYVAARSPVPGGVGPMTIAMLMRNVASLALKKPIV